MKKIISGECKVPATGVFICSSFDSFGSYIEKNHYPIQKYIYINGYLYSLNRIAAPNQTFISFN